MDPTKLAPEMPQSMVAQPSVFVVDSQARYVPPHDTRRGGASQSLLCVLVVLALLGMIVEACFIYHLYTSRTAAEATAEKVYQEKLQDVQPTRRTSAFVRPRRPTAHLTVGSSIPRPDGVMLWSMQSLSYEVDHVDGRLTFRKEGYYFVYTKVYFKEVVGSLFVHAVKKSTTRLPGEDVELMRSRTFVSTPGSHGNQLNSYLAGAFLMHEGDSVYVKVDNFTKLLRQSPSDNFFGAYML